MLRVLHVLDHSLPLHSGYAFRTRAIMTAQMADGLEVRLWHSPAAWCFAEWGRFADPGLRHHIVPQSRNAALLPLTRDVTRYEPAGTWPAERGLALSEVEGALGRTLPRYGLRDLKAPPGRQDRRPEGAVAGALGLALAGPRRYGTETVNDPWIGDGRARATALDIRRALYLYVVAGLILAALIGALLLGRPHLT